VWGWQRGAQPSGLGRRPEDAGPKVARVEATATLSLEQVVVWLEAALLDVITQPINDVGPQRRHCANPGTRLGRTFVQRSPFILGQGGLDTNAAAKKVEMPDPDDGELTNPRARVREEGDAELPP
jgi:hypothetical protein